MVVRLATSLDAGEIGRVSLSTGQPEFDSGADERYLRLLFSTGSVVVAEGSEHAIVGWGAAREGHLGSMLTDLFVDPVHQGAGIGRALLGRLWPGRSPSRRFTFSSQHPHALSLYIRAGLTTRWPLLYVTGRHESAGGSDLSARLVSASVAARAETEMVGGERFADYRYWTSSQESAGVLISRDAAPVAVGAIRPDELMHLACAPFAEAASALRAAVSLCASTEVRLCLPGGHPALADLLAVGFRITEHDIAMASHSVDLPTQWVYSPGLG